MRTLRQCLSSFTDGVRASSDHAGAHGVSPLLVAALVAGAAVPVVSAQPRPAIQVEQRNRMFSQATLDVAPGAVVRFSNRDEFPHQVHVTGPNRVFASELQEPGAQTEVAFPAAGIFDVRCGIHPRMRMAVNVEDRP